MLALLKVAQEKMHVMSASPRTALLYVAGYVPSQPGLPLYGYLVINVYVILNNAVVTGTLLTLLALLALVWIMIVISLSPATMRSERYFSPRDIFPLQRFL